MSEDVFKEELDLELWNTVHPSDLWVFDKLIVAKFAGHLCGPRGSYIPKDGDYIVRPVINTLGMGYMARIAHLEAGFAKNMHPAEFWCEVFEGPHISVDYEYGKPILSVVGTKHPKLPLQRFTRWEKTEESIPLPNFLFPVANRYRYINCEFIGGKIIEVHLRRNPDFRWGNKVMIPAWLDEEMPAGVDGMAYEADDPTCPSKRAGMFYA